MMDEMLAALLQHFSKCLLVFWPSFGMLDFVVGNYISVCSTCGFVFYFQFVLVSIHFDSLFYHQSLRNSFFFFNFSILNHENFVQNTDVVFLLYKFRNNENGKECTIIESLFFFSFIYLKKVSFFFYKISFSFHFVSMLVNCIVFVIFWISPIKISSINFFLELIKIYESFYWILHIEFPFQASLNYLRSLDIELCLFMGMFCKFCEYLFSAICV